MERGNDGDLDLAFADLERAIEIDPNLATAWVNRGNALLRKGEDGDFEQAMADFTKAIDLAPDNPLGYYNRALAHSKAENWETRELRPAGSAGARSAGAGNQQRAVPATGRPTPA